MKNYDIFDLTKFILSFMIVGIHTKLLPMIIYPWARLAVPIFFIISSFLLFNKINYSKDNKRIIIKHFIIRLLKLYIFWFIVLLPITVLVRKDWFSDGILYGILNIIIRPFTSSTFIASWYISALIIGTLIVDKISEVINYKYLIGLFLIAYLGCCYISSYNFLCNFSLFHGNFIDPQCSFLVSLIYILFGKIISENKFKINNKTNLILIIVFLILLYIEWFIIYRITLKNTNDCYIMVLPTTVLVFNYIKSINITLKNPKLLRQLSSFIYPSHASVALIINYFSKLLFVNNELLQGVFNYIITLTICVTSFFIVKKLETKLKILKYSY